MSENESEVPEIPVPPPVFTDKRLLFIELMATGRYSATRAYVEAGYAEASANVEACKALANPSVRAAVDKKRRELVAAGLVPNVDDIMYGLAIEARGERDDTTAAARVAAWRTLAAVSGLLDGGRSDLPDAALQLLEALGRGIGDSKQSGTPIYEGKGRWLPSVSETQNGSHPEADGDTGDGPV